MITFIGDVHGVFKEYKKLIAAAEYSIQLGDFGFDYSVLKSKSIDPHRHRVLAGNHDNYQIMENFPHFLGDFGNVIMDNREIFFIRGGHSIDKKYRKEYVSWWPNEELSYAQQLECIDLYTLVRPSIIISHEAPSFLSRIIGSPRTLREFGYKSGWSSDTQKLLSVLWNIHSPKLWVFGHLHRDYQCKIGETLFVCVDTLNTFTH